MREDGDIDRGTIGIEYKSGRTHVKWIAPVVVCLIIISGFSFWMGRKSVYRSGHLRPTITHALINEQGPTVTTNNIPTPSDVTSKKCLTIEDCMPFPECSQKTIDMFGNRSHCPIIECNNGFCIDKLVP